MNNCRILLAIALVLAYSINIWAQAVTGTLLGTVTDASGALVAGAKVTAVEANTGVSRVTESSAGGQYSFTNLPPGVYNVTIEQPGFRKVLREKVEVLVNSTIRVDVALEVGNVSEQIIVTAEAPLLQTDRTDTGRKIDTKTIVDLPLPMNRNFQGLLNLVPGTTRAFRPHSQFFNSQDSLATNVNGQSRLGNNVQFEGVDNNHRTGLLTVLIPPVEALQTVDITTSNYEAELGRAGGAVTNVTLKSGTNEFHGSAYWYNRVSALGSRNTFLTRRPRSVYNYAGVTFGGPIIRNRTFFFADFLGVRDRLGYGQLLSSPSEAWRRGDFTGATVIYNPFSGNPDGSGRTPFPGNIVPESLISPIARRMLAQIPGPTRSGNASNFERASVQAKDTDSWDAKIDHQITDGDRLSFRYSYQKPEVSVPPVYGLIGGPSGTGNDGFAGTGTNKTLSSAVNYTHVFSPTLITELRLGVSRYRNDAQNSDYGQNTGNDIGIRNANVSEFTSGMTSIDITGFSNPVIGYSASMPWIRSETNWNLVSNWTKIAGAHTFKFGFDARLNRDLLLQTQTWSPRGRFNFRVGQTSLRGAGATPTSSANAFASFLLDVPDEYGRDVPAISPDYIQKPFFTYVQDKWQLSPKLTIDIGVRHELYPPAKPRVPAGFSNYNPLNNTLELAGVGSIPENLGRKTYWTNFAPRFGISYRFNDKTVIRTGYGISYLPYPDNSYAFNFPVRQNNAFPEIDAFVPNGSMARGFDLPRSAEIPASGIITTPSPGESYNIIPKDYHEGYVQSFNFAVQRSLPGQFVMELAYVGNLGIRNPAVYNMNASFIENSGSNGRPLFQQFRRTANTEIRFVGTSTNYNSMQVKFDRRYSAGYQLTTAYTYSKSIDYVTNNGGLRFYVDQQRNRARSDFDRTHTFVQSHIFELPFGKGKRWANSGIGMWLLGGWQVNGVLSVMSGLPLNFSNARSQYNTPGSTGVPNIVAPFKVLGGIGANAYWFDPSSFDAPPNGQQGNLGRNVLNGPGFFNLDASIFRRFPITERVNLEFRGEAYNVTNTPQYATPNVELGNVNFGRITGLQGDSVGNPRQVQLGMRVVF
jgi:outer membrane receptor protein involved in Fe transport